MAGAARELPAGAGPAAGRRVRRLRLARHRVLVARGATRRRARRAGLHAAAGVAARGHLLRPGAADPRLRRQRTAAGGWPVPALVRPLPLPGRSRGGGGGGVVSAHARARGRAAAWATALLRLRRDQGAAAAARRMGSGRRAAARDRPALLGLAVRAVVRRLQLVAASRGCRAARVHAAAVGHHGRVPVRDPGPGLRAGRSSSSGPTTSFCATCAHTPHDHGAATRRSREVGRAAAREPTSRRHQRGRPRGVHRLVRADAWLRARAADDRPRGRGPGGRCS